MVSSELTPQSPVDIWREPMRCVRFLKHANRGEIYFSLYFGNDLNLVWTLLRRNGLKFIGIRWCGWALSFAKIQRLLRMSGVFKFEPCGGLKFWRFEVGIWVSLFLITQQQQIFPPGYELLKPFLTSTLYKFFERTIKFQVTWRKLLRATSSLKFGRSVFRPVPITFWDAARRSGRSFASTEWTRAHWSALSRRVARRLRRYKVFMDLNQWKVQPFISYGNSAPINELLLRTCEGSAQSTFFKIQLPYHISWFPSLTPQKVSSLCRKFSSRSLFNTFPLWRNLPI